MVDLVESQLSRQVFSSHPTHIECPIRGWWVGSIQRLLTIKAYLARKAAT